jgi:uncharacterized iron-regulated membrane protein
LRKLVFWVHLAAGVTAGVIVLVMSVTGVLLAYERQVTAWAERDARRVQPPAGAARLPVEELAARAAATAPGTSPTGVTLWSDPAAAAAVALGRERVVYVNPYTGHLAGTGSPAIRGFFHAVTDWHRWLGASGESRPFFRGVTGVCNLAFLVIVLTGPILWWPRDRSWRRLRPVVLFQGQLTGRARDFNWHNVIGLWTAAPLAVIVASGAVISYPWASDLVYRLAGEKPPPGRGPAGAPEAGSRRAATPPDLAGLETAWRHAERQVEGWKSVSLRVPAAADAPLAFTIDRGDGGRPNLRAQLTLDRRTGEIVRFEPFTQQSPGRRARTWLRFAHTGEAAGLAGQTIAGLASAGASVLVWTGLSLAYRRFRAWQRRDVKAPSTRIVEQFLEDTP